MRTAEDFNRYYATPDPWHISRARFRDKVLRRCLKRFVRNKSVLELGCGEGHLTQAVFYKARSVTGVDISDVAIGRAKSLNLANARFENADLLHTAFNGYDVIAAIECIHYLSHRDQGAFLEKVAREHPGKMLLLWDSCWSNPTMCPSFGIRFRPRLSATSSNCHSVMLCLIRCPSG